MVSACARRRQVGYAHTRGISLRRACQLLSVLRSAGRYQSRLIAKDAPALSCMRKLSGQYSRFRHRWIHVLLDREGHSMSPDRTSSARTERRSIRDPTTAQSLFLVRSRKPWQNDLNESFNGKFRDEYLSMEWCRNRIDMKIVIESWRRHFNEVRP
jgi:integrase-like protein